MQAKSSKSRMENVAYSFDSFRKDRLGHDVDADTDAFSKQHASFRDWTLSELKLCCRMNMLCGVLKVALFNCTVLH